MREEYINSLLEDLYEEVEDMSGPQAALYALQIVEELTDPDDIAIFRSAFADTVNRVKEF